MKGGGRKVEKIASELGFNLLGRIVEDHYLLEAPHNRRYVKNLINWISIDCKMKDISIDPPTFSRFLKRFFCFFLSIFFNIALENKGNLENIFVPGYFLILEPLLAVISAVALRCHYLFFPFSLKTRVKCHFLSVWRERCITPSPLTTNYTSFFTK